MIGEKTADVVLVDALIYPERLESLESFALHNRRALFKAQPPAPNPAALAPGKERLPPDTVGLALSGGGVRSATFSLGVIQALAKRNALGRVDFMSTVSGGGYIGAFLGRLFTRLDKDVANPGERVREIVANTSSDEIWWLRAHARYLSGEGRADFVENVGVVFRNLVSLHFCVATLLLALFASLRYLTDHWVLGVVPAMPKCTLGPSHAPCTLSPWWWLPPLILLVGILPAVIGFYLTPKPGTRSAHPLFGLLAWLAGLGAAVGLLVLTDAILAALSIIAVLLLAWLWQEMAQWFEPKSAQSATRGVVARTRLSSALGFMLSLTLASAVWVVLDTLARWSVASQRVRFTVGIPMAVIAIGEPLLRTLATSLLDRLKAGATWAMHGLIAVLAFSLVFFLVFALDALGHRAFAARTGLGLWLLLSALGLGLVLGPASTFINLSSLLALYAARLARTYLGASNEARVHAASAAVPRPVDAADPNDDIYWHHYHPEQRAGPLHLLNVCVNDSVDQVSGRQLTQDKGLSMCLGPVGVTVGQRFHALWEEAGNIRHSMSERMLRAFEQPPSRPEERSALRALRVDTDPNSFHVFADRKHPSEPVAVEPLRLSQWTAISGAAVSTGEGRLTTLPMSLLLGIFNVRLGYWWNSGIGAGRRPGEYPTSFLERLARLPSHLFRTQWALLNEWRGYFPGPTRRLWNLSDGGHFENTGLYELIRRRTALMIAVLGDHDPDYVFGDLALLVRKARLDFGAVIDWIDVPCGAAATSNDWSRFDQISGSPLLPPGVRGWLDARSLGPLSQLARSSAFAAALGRVHYLSSQAISWLLILRPCLVDAGMPLDLRSYARTHDAFPNDTTLDQFPSDDQWECYRLLGERVGLAVFRSVTE